MKAFHSVVVLFVLLQTASNISSSTITRYSDSRRSSAISSPTRSVDSARSPRHLSVAQQQQDAAAAAAEKSSTSMSSIYGKNSGVEIKTCAALQEIALVRIPAQGDNWWCILVCVMRLRCVFAWWIGFSMYSLFNSTGILVSRSSRESGRYGGVFCH